MDNCTILYTKKIELAEKKSDNGNLVAKFILCDFNANKNKVKLNRNTIENWYRSIINQPLVGKIIGNDFSSHRMKIVSKKNENGKIEKSVEFDTDAFGVFTSADIEKIDDVEYITATAEIWSRYPKACDLIKKRIENGTLYTSWEVKTNESHKESDIKVIDDGIFTAHCLLASTVEPAYDSSHLLEVAETQKDEELISALSSDLNIIDKEEETLATKSKKDDISIEEEKEVTSEVENEEEKDTKDTEELDDKNKEKDTEVSALTDRDIRKKLEDKVNEDRSGTYLYLSMLFPADFYALFSNWKDNDLDFTAVTYSVTDNDVEIVEKIPVTLMAHIRDINETISSKDDALTKASEKINSLEEQIAQLAPYKEQIEFEKAEKEKAEKEAKKSELSAYALKSQFISQEELDNDDEIKTMISELNEAGIKQIIATRFMESLNEEKKEEKGEIETSSKIETYLNEDEINVNPISLYING